MANCVIAYNPCFSCDEKKCEICELDMHRKRVFQQSEWEWIFEHEIYGKMLCSNCKEEALVNENNEYVDSDFCPNCGAKMKGGRNENNNRNT